MFLAKLRQIRHGTEWHQNTPTHPDPVNVMYNKQCDLWTLMTTNTPALGKIHNVFSNFLRNFDNFFYTKFNEPPSPILSISDPSENYNRDRILVVPLKIVVGYMGQKYFDAERSKTKKF